MQDNKKKIYGILWIFFFSFLEIEGGKIFIQQM